jgi:hypothetical protein
MKLDDKLKMRRAPFRALFKQLIREEQQKYKSLKDKEIRTAKLVPQAVQSDMEHAVIGDGLALMGISARHASRNTINPDDVAFVSCLYDVAGGSTAQLSKLKTASAKNAERRMAERKVKKDAKDEEDRKNGVVKEKKPKSERKIGKKKAAVVTETVPALVAA